MLNNYCIYKHTAPNGKAYIGQTNNYRLRNNRHKSKSGCSAFSSAIKKYGWDNFKHEILIDNLSVEEANNLEKFYIVIENTLSPNGYNLRTGGDNYVLSQEGRKNIGMASKGRIPHNLGKENSEETRKKISESLTGHKYGIGRVQSEDAKRKMSEYAKNRPEEHNRKISESKKGHKSCLGRILSEETRNKIRDKAIGRKQSIETIEKRIETRKRNKESKAVA